MHWSNRKGKGAWDETRVREAKGVRAGTDSAGSAVHFNRICELLYEKKSELDESDILRKLKGTCGTP